MSKENIYPELSDKVVKRYAKVPIHIVAGVRIDPYDARRQVAWLLETQVENFDVKSKARTFNYEDEVIELYSDFEVDSFVRLNRKLIAAGTLKVYEGTGSLVNEVNTMSDSQLIEIINLRANVDFQEQLEQITSALTLVRMKHLATEAGKSIKRIQMIESRIEVLDNGDN
jgi:hypothetical protein